MPITLLNFTFCTIVENPIFFGFRFKYTTLYQNYLLKLSGSTKCLLETLYDTEYYVLFSRVDRNWGRLLFALLSIKVSPGISHSEKMGLKIHLTQDRIMDTAETHKATGRTPQLSRIDACVGYCEKM
jgi:hypothetical protein